jgi:NADH-quinone oxidoreductase subunit J
VGVSQIVFLAIGALTLVAAVGAVTRQTAFPAALWCLLASLGVATTCLLLGSPLLAGVQLFLGAGGTVLLGAFAAAVTREGTRHGSRDAPRAGVAALVAVALFMVLAWSAFQLPLATAPAVTPSSSMDDVTALGAALMDPRAYLLPLQVIAVMLMVVLIGALYLVGER